MQIQMRRLSEAFRRGKLVLGFLLVLLLIAYRRICRGMNRPERFLKPAVLARHKGRRAAPFGSGLQSGKLHWTEQLVPPQDPIEAVHELCTLLRLHPPLTLHEATEGVRRMLLDLSPAKPGEGTEYWSEQDCASIATSLLAEPAVASMVEKSERESRVKAWPAGELPPTVQTPLLLQIPQMATNATGAMLMMAAGFSSRIHRSKQFELHYYDSLNSRGGTPMVLVHGLFTTAVSMGLLAVLLRSSRRVLVLDLPDFDYGYSHTVPVPSEGQPRIGGLELHIAAVRELLQGVLRASAESPVDLCGHSYGGHIVKQAAAAEGAAVRQLHLLTPAGAGAGRVFSRMFVPPDPGSTPLFVKWVVEPVLRAVFMSPNAMNLFAEIDYSYHTPAPCEHLANVMLGSGDLLVPPRPAHVIAPRFIRGEGHLVHGGGHLLNVVPVVAIAEHMAKFASRHGEQPPDQQTDLARWLVWAGLGWIRLPFELMFDTTGSLDPIEDRSEADKLLHAAL